MNSKHWFSLGAVALIAGGALSLRAPAGAVDLGDSVSHSFRSQLVNGLGVKSLSDLHGKPVLVEFWGTH